MLDIPRPQAHRSSNFAWALNRALDSALELTGAPFGNVQLMDWKKGYLTIAAQRGFNDEFLSFFHKVKTADGSACARAMRSRNTMVVEDVLRDPEFAPCRTIMMDASVRAVVSIPLISRHGALVGVLSTHFDAKHAPCESELQAVRRLAEQTAHEIIRLRTSKTTDKQIEKAVKAIRSSYRFMRIGNGLDFCLDAEPEQPEIPPGR